MDMKKILVLVFVVMIKYCWAQQETTALHTVSSNSLSPEFEVGTQTYLLADQVNIRKTPSSKATISVNLPIGTAIKILKATTQELHLNGVTASWYEVSFVETKGITQGYVWGGLIAKGKIPSTVDNNLFFLYGIARKKVHKEDEDGRVTITAQIRACKANKELSRIEFPVLLATHHQLSNYGNRGLKTIVDVLEYEVSQEFYGGQNLTTVIFWDGQELHKVVEEVEGWYDQDKVIDVIKEHKKIACVWIKDELEELKVLLDYKRK